MSNIRYCILFPILLLKLNVFCQDALEPLYYNPSLIEKGLEHKTGLKHLKGDTLINLPFFDDFSDSYFYPKDTLWADSNVYINTSFSDDPISIGVATFDALDKNGMLYPMAKNSKSFIADLLTSSTFNFLSNTPKDSIYLSFFYQPGGIGEPPFTGDSLVLQFYAPSKKKWNTVWSIPGSSVNPFKLVMIPVKDTQYLQNGFKFHFFNYTNINIDNNVPAKNSNGVIWNLDYVYLNKNRSFDDTVFHDLAIIRPLYSPLKDYESIPWKHYMLPDVRSKALSDSLKLYIRNNDTISRGTQRTYIVKYENSNSYPFGPSSATQAGPGQIVVFNDILQEPLISDNEISAKFVIKANLDSTLSNEHKSNDTIEYTQIFSDYYAYDDGSAEYGYGFKGEGSANAMLAYKFKNYKISDSLLAVNIFFNRSLNNANLDSFFLTVWGDNNGIPGDILFKKSKCYDKAYLTIDTTHIGFNRFNTYLLDTPVIVPETFYVGWIQDNSEKFFNAGFDKNKITKAKIFFNLQGTPDAWTQSSQKGALMIRPILGSRPILPFTKSIANVEFKIYPNPVSDRLFIRAPSVSFNSKNSVFIYDITGKIILRKIFNNNSIDIADLKPGLYFLRLQTNKDNIFNARFIKNSR